MKKYNFKTMLSVACVSAATTISALALPMGSSNDPFDYAIKGKELNWLSMGVYGGQFNRDIKWDKSGIVQKLTSNRIQTYIGADIAKWVTLYAIFGTSESTIEDGDYADFSGEYGLGLRANLLNHMIKEPTLTCDAIRFNFNASWVHSSSDMVFDDIDWDDFSAALTMELVNNTTGNKFYSPESINLYLGPVFSALAGDDFSEDTNFGGVVGVEMFVVDSLSVSVEWQYFDESSIAGGIYYHF